MKLPTKAPQSVLKLTLHELAKELLRLIKSTKANNAKLGGMYSWSLPSVDTCPGRTSICEGMCYDRKIVARRASVRTGRLNRYLLTLHPLFGEALTLALKMLPPSLLRIHVGGDFYSVPYFKSWERALRLNQHIKGFAFTRSWRSAPILSAIRAANTPSWLLASTDPETGPSPVGMREASMSMTRKSQVKKGVSPAPSGTCPEQVGLKTGCDTCGRCPMASVGESGIRLLPTAAKAGVVFLSH